MQPGGDGSPGWLSDDGGVEAANLRRRRPSGASGILPGCMSKDQWSAAVAPAGTDAAGMSRSQSCSVMGPCGDGEGSFAFGQPVPLALAVVGTPDAAGESGMRSSWTSLNAALRGSMPIPEALNRAVSMIGTYPLMQVDKTAFENALTVSRHGSRAPCDGSHSSDIRDQCDGASRCGSFSCTMDADEHALNRLARSRRTDSVVSAASRMKCMYMWRAIVATIVANEALVQSYRTTRLRSVLKDKLLPHLLDRRESMMSMSRQSGDWPASGGGDGDADGAAAEAESVVVPKTVRSESKKPNVGQRNTPGPSCLPSDGGVSADAQSPQGSLLAEHNELFASLNNLSFCNKVARTMDRQRFMPGEDIVRAGERSQTILYFLASGKCMLRRAAAAPPSEFPTARGGRSSGVGGMAKNWALNTPVTSQRGGSLLGGPEALNVSAVESGHSFGGVFGSFSYFVDTYTASTQCIVWSITKAKFEQALAEEGDKRVHRAFEEAKRSHFESYLREWYPIETQVHRVPIYRRIRDIPLVSYMADFQPTVLVEGDQLFDEGDEPNEVYCLLEGEVLRQQRGGPEGTFEQGTRQFYGMSELAHHSTRRFIVLGEEPLILSGKQLYRCTVSSPVALFYKVSGKRFVDTLLDDPCLYVQLRRDVMRLRQSQMHLDPAVLSQIPLLSELPAARLATLADHATARVVERSRTICEISQPVKEIFIVVRGEVTDPRNYSRRPRPLHYAEVMGANHSIGCDGEGHGELFELMRGSTGTHPGLVHASGPVTSRQRDRKGGRVALDSAAASPAKEAHPSGGKRRGPAVKPVVGSELMSASLRGYNPLEAHAVHGNGRRGSGLRIGLGPSDTLGSNNSRAVVEARDAAVYADEQTELNPPLPANPVRRIVFALGGDWEGLLSEKWQCGWEASTTVELFALPTYDLRVEYNNLMRQQQNALLGRLRELQRQDLGLRVPIVAKLPPMSVYHPPTKRSNTLNQMKKSDLERLLDSNLLGTDGVTRSQMSSRAQSFVGAPRKGLMSTKPSATSRHTAGQVTTASSRSSAESMILPQGGGMPAFAAGFRPIDQRSSLLSLPDLPEGDDKLKTTGAAGGQRAAKQKVAAAQKGKDLSCAAKKPSTTPNRKETPRKGASPRTLPSNAAERNTAVKGGPLHPIKPKPAAATHATEAALGCSTAAVLPPLKNGVILQQAAHSSSTPCAVRADRIGHQSLKRGPEGHARDPEQWFQSVPAVAPPLGVAMDLGVPSHGGMPLYVI